MKSKFNKRILALVLVVVMAVSIMAISVVSASAAEISSVSNNVPNAQEILEKVINYIVEILTKPIVPKFS